MKISLSSSSTRRALVPLLLAAVTAVSLAGCSTLLKQKKPVTGSGAKIHSSKAAKKPAVKKAAPKKFTAKKAAPKKK